MKPAKTLPHVGERLVVHGLFQYESTVIGVEWDEERSAWRIDLDWGIHGQSRVWAHDENKVWFRWRRNS